MHSDVTEVIALLEAAEWTPCYKLSEYDRLAYRIYEIKKMIINLSIYKVNGRVCYVCIKEALLLEMLP